MDGWMVAGVSGCGWRLVLLVDTSSTTLAGLVRRYLVFEWWQCCWHGQWQCCTTAAAYRGGCIGPSEHRIIRQLQIPSWWKRLLCDLRLLPIFFSTIIWMPSSVIKPQSRIWSVSNRVHLVEMWWSVASVILRTQPAGNVMGYYVCISPCTNKWYISRSEYSRQSVMFKGALLFLNLYEDLFFQIFFLLFLLFLWFWMLMSHSCCRFSTPIMSIRAIRY